MCSERPSRAARRWAAAGLALCALAGAGACGKKGDPAPPLRFVPQTTDQLTVEQRHLDLILELPYPKTTAAGMALPGLDRVEVWEVRKVAPGALDAPEDAAGDAGEAAGEAGEAAA
ncbi:MAG TPA: hypothetical protein VHM02_03620, partial [Thermoanaerobaculia bacterium]|nr:hypothetical protein [Thermoanaerobaculia bacterium]